MNQAVPTVKQHRTQFMCLSLGQGCELSCVPPACSLLVSETWDRVSQSECLDPPTQEQSHSPDAVQKVRVVVRVHEEVVPHYMVQCSVAILEVIQHTKDGAVLVIR